MRILTVAGSALLFLAASNPSYADNLTGATKFLCSPATVVLCTDDGECDTGTAASLNLPQFIQVDVQAKLLSTTAASAARRVTPIRYVERANGQIIAQGTENGRAFSWVIDEATGAVTVAVAFEQFAATAFGMCTPLPAL